MSESDATATPPVTVPIDRHEPRGRKPNDQLPPSRAREVQRAFRLRRAEHLAALEERINLLESENSQLRAMLALPEADRVKIGSGPTGRGKSVKEGGVPMSERVRARKEARERERRAKGLPEPESSGQESDRNLARDSATLSPRAVTGNSSSTPLNSSTNPTSILFPPVDGATPFNYQLPLQFNLGVHNDNAFPDFSNTMDTNLFKANASTPGSTANLFQNMQNMFAMFDTPQNNNNATPSPSLPVPPSQRSPISAALTPSTPTSQPDLLTRLKSCCHLSDSHVVNDPGLLIFATRLCQSYPCSLSGAHPEDPTVASDSEYLLLDDSWKALKAQLDPGGEADGEHRLNTGRMAGELVCRAAASRGTGWILCRFREGMSIKRSMIAQLIQGFGGKFE